MIDAHDGRGHRTSYNEIITVEHHSIFQASYRTYFRILNDSLNFNWMMKFIDLATCRSDHDLTMVTWIRDGSEPFFFITDAILKSRVYPHIMMIIWMASDPIQSSNACTKRDYIVLRTWPHNPEKLTEIDLYRRVWWRNFITYWRKILLSIKL